MEPEPTETKEAVPAEPAEPPAPPAPRERFALLTPGGPLIVDAIIITVDGLPYTEAATAAPASPSDDPSAPDAAPPNDDAAEENPDSKADAKDSPQAPDPNASSNYPTPDDAPQPPRPFAIRSSRDYAPDPRSTSRAWQLLDADRDGRLSAEELDRAADRLWSRDAEDDRVIAPAELAPLRDQLDGDATAANGRRTAASPASHRRAAVALTDKTDFEQVDYTFQELYSPLQDLSAKSFRDLPKLFGELDLDADGWLDHDEFARLLKVPPHLELAVTFTRPSSTENSAATVTVLHSAPELTALPGATPDRLVLALGASRILITANDLTPPPRSADSKDAPAASGMQQPEPGGVLVSLVVHDRGDVLFEALDANSDGRLGEREIATAPRLLRKRDANGDGQVTANEAPYQMTIAFLRGEPAGRRSFRTPPSTKATDAAAAAPPWFASADLNRDGDVSPREFLGSADQFKKLDANADGYIDPAEAAAAR